jgi:hypothetical protein
MNRNDVEGSLEIFSTQAPYDKPRLERLGTLRELTQCRNYTLLDLLLGRHVDGCALTGSTFHTWHR